MKRKRFWAYGMAWLLVLAGSVSASLPALRLPEPGSIRADSCASSCAEATADKFVAKHAGVVLQHDHHNWLTNVTTTVTGGPAWNVGYRYDVSVSPGASGGASGD